jgi:nitrite reductase/ring-hydroxylating ferredoxin subunit
VSVVRVGRLDDLEPCQSVEADGATLLLTVEDGVPHAVDGRCLRRGGPLQDGLVRDGVVTCPWHWWRFDLRTGDHLGGEGRLPSYACTVTPDGWVEVDLPDISPVRSIREMLLAHARGESP